MTADEAMKEVKMVVEGNYIPAEKPWTCKRKCNVAMIMEAISEQGAMLLENADQRRSFKLTPS